MPWQVYNSAGQLLQATDLPDNAVTNAKVADDAIGVVELSATGTASSSTFLRGDNAWAAAGGLSAASQAEMEAASSNTVATTPGRTQNHPGVAKIWASWSFSGGGSPTLIASHNYTSISAGGGTGDADHLWATDFSGSTVYALIGTGGQERVLCPQNGTLAAGGVTTVTTGTNGSAVNSSDNFLAGFGDQ
jgi:hypothetical protein